MRTLLKRIAASVVPYLVPVAIVVLALATGIALRVVVFVPEAHAALYAALAYAPLQ